MYAGATVLLRQHPSDCTFVRRYAKRSTTPRRFPFKHKINVSINYIAMLDVGKAS